MYSTTRVSWFFDVLLCLSLRRTCPLLFFFFFNDTATTEIYTLSLHDALPISVVGEREAPGPVGDAFGLQLLLGLADPGDLRGGVDHPRDGVVVHVAALPGDDLGHHHALVLALVREHRPAHHVADGVDARQAGAAVLVDLDEALGVQLEADILGAQAIGVRHAAD